LLRAELDRFSQQLTLDRSRYYREAAPLLAGLRDGGLSLSTVLSRLEIIREDVYVDLASRYGSYLRSLRHLAADIDIDAALVWNSGQRSELERRIEDINALAQLGITVEIIGHELNELDSELGRGLRRLPKEVQLHEGFRIATTAHRALMEKLRFLAPLRLSGPRLREEITGQQIYDYLASFFGTQIEARSVLFGASDSFMAMKIVEFRSRIYPVFANLISNALYWVGREDGEREVHLDFRDGFAIVADSGRGVDPDDIERLFQLFFTRRAEGRGVGLYLARLNLETGGHSIRYVTNGALQVLKGANFAIEFRGVKHG